MFHIGQNGGHAHRLLGLSFKKEKEGTSIYFLNILFFEISEGFYSDHQRKCKCIVKTVNNLLSVWLMV